MTTLKAIIVDDETQLRSHLRSQLMLAWPDLEICCEARSGQEAIELIHKYQPDIAFLDIKMPGLSGIDVAKKIFDKCWIVFVTAYDQYAIEAFESEAVDYLLKPVTIERLEKTVMRIKKRISGSPDQQDKLKNLLARLEDALTKQNGSATALQWIKSQQGNDISLISVNDVFCFVAQDKYTAVITEDGESLIQTPIKDLAEELDQNIFWQINRGVIVNVRCIDKVSRSITGRFQLRLKGYPDVLTVSRTFSHRFKQT
jgi:DNA-binding LytR/AlgR family response regulator